MIMPYNVLKQATVVLLCCWFCKYCDSSYQLKHEKVSRLSNLKQSCLFDFFKCGQLLSLCIHGRRRVKRKEKITCF